MKKFNPRMFLKRIACICLKYKILRGIWSSIVSMLTINNSQHTNDYQEIVAYVNEYRPTKLESSIFTVHNYSEENRNDLDIIIPVYNVAQHVSECVDSILGQKTKYRFRIILVEDGSTDGSDKIIKKYEQSPQVKIISQNNQGLSGARNTGLEIVNSSYVMFVDSDDRMPSGSLDNLLDLAFRVDADLVEGSYSEFSDGHILKKFIHKDTDKANTNSLYGYAWGKLIKTDYFLNLQFPVGYLFEDTIFTFILYNLVNKVVTTSYIVYEYRINQNGINLSSKGNYSRIDTFWVTQLIMNEISLFGIEKNEKLYEILLNQLIVNGRRLLQVQPLALQKSVFELSAKEIQKNWLNIPVTNELEQIEQIFLKEKFSNYLLYCLSM